MNCKQIPSGLFQLNLPDSYFTRSSTSSPTTFGDSVYCAVKSNPTPIQKSVRTLRIIASETPAALAYPSDFTVNAVDPSSMPTRNGTNANAVFTTRFIHSTRYAYGHPPAPEFPPRSRRGSDEATQSVPAEQKRR